MQFIVEAAQFFPHFEQTQAHARFDGSAASGFLAISAASASK
jgi:hypothetical protein